MPEMAARTLRLCLPLQKIPREARLLQEAQICAESGSRQQHQEQALTVLGHAVIGRVDQMRRD